MKKITNENFNNELEIILGKGKKEIKEDGKVHYKGALTEDMFEEMMNDPSSVLDL